MKTSCAPAAGARTLSTVIKIATWPGKPAALARSPGTFSRFDHTAMGARFPFKGDPRRVRGTAIGAHSSVSRHRLISRLGNLVPHGISHDVDDRFGPQLVHDRSAMGLYRLDTDSKHRGDFLVALALGQELDDFAFAPSDHPSELDLLRRLCYPEK